MKCSTRLPISFFRSSPDSRGWDKDKVWGTNVGMRQGTEKIDLLMHIVW